MTTALGFAKVNITLRVSAVRPDGLHPIQSLVTTVDWSDRLSASRSSTDSLMVDGPHAGGVPADASNLVSQAVDVYRRETGSDGGFAFVLTKHIPPASGIGGGSADAAAALRIMDSAGGTDLAGRLAPSIGADVPFALRGGWATMAGHGEQLEPEDITAGFVLAMVVPPLEVSTASVYRRWDDLGGPAGEPLDDRSIPNPLRRYWPIVNDLYPAAVDLVPEIGGWRRELEQAWSRGVMMSGSGSTLFSFFESEPAAAEALEPYRSRARAVRVASPGPHGARIDQG